MVMQEIHGGMFTLAIRNQQIGRHPIPTRKIKLYALCLISVSLFFSHHLHRIIISLGWLRSHQIKYLLSCLGFPFLERHGLLAISPSQWISETCLYGVNVYWHFVQILIFTPFLRMNGQCAKKESKSNEIP